MKLHILISAALALVYAVTGVSAAYPIFEADFDSADLEEDFEDEAFFANTRDRSCNGRGFNSCERLERRGRCEWRGTRRGGRCVGLSRRRSGSGSGSRGSCSRIGRRSECNDNWRCKWVVRRGSSRFDDRDRGRCVRR